MINPALRLATWREALQREGRAQVLDYLQPDAAQRLYECLSQQVRWTLAIRDDAGPRTVPADQYAAMDADTVDTLLRDTAGGAREGRFRFAYDCYMMVAAYKEGRDPGLPLHRVLEFFNSPDYLDFMRALTGDPQIRRVSAQATRYRPGHFLRHHDDTDVEEGRRFAYVLNLSPRWHPDWGGLLQFVGPDGRVQDTFVPRWNSLSLFRVPAGHIVSLVAPWADDDRLAITGWLQS
jgi:SM-20-related protein